MEIKRHFVTILQKRLKQPLHFIQVVTGPRQVGKTTGLEQLTSGWSRPSLMATADNIAPPTSHWIEVQWRKAHALGEGTLLVIDEIQKIPNWTETVKLLFDKERRNKRINVVLLGSASLSLQRGLSESLAGRYEVLHVHHWQFGECKEAFDWTLDQFLMFGGYPAGAELIEDIPRWQSFIREGIIEPVLTKDLQGMVNIRKPALFRQLFELALKYPSQEISFQKILGQLQDRGNATTIKHYLTLFEGAFLLKPLQKYSGKPIQIKASSPKILPLNLALVNAFSDPEWILSDPEYRGRIFETAIGAYLATLPGELFYWRDGKYEVDFIFKTKDALYAIEVKSGRKKSYAGLAQFISKFPQAMPITIDSNNGSQLLLGAGIDTIQPIQ